jgi:hypothetical protein
MCQTLPIQLTSPRVSVLFEIWSTGLHVVPESFQI